MVALRIYLHGYCSSFIIVLLIFFLSLVSVGLCFSHFFSLLSLLIFSFSLTPHSLSTSMGLINLFFSTCFKTSLSASSFQPASMGLINFFFSHSLSVGPLRRRQLWLEWV